MYSVVLIYGGLFSLAYVLMVRGLTSFQSFKQRFEIVHQHSVYACTRLVRIQYMLNDRHRQQRYNPILCNTFQ